MDPAAPALIDVVLADDHARMRADLRLLLDAAPGIRVVAEADDVAAALSAAASLRPRVVVLDLNMPGGATLPAIPSFREAAPDVAIVVLTMDDSAAFAHEAIAAGASGYVLKDAAHEELAEAVRAVAAGAKFLSPLT